MTPRLLMSVSAAVLGAAGLALLFLPDELQRLATGSTPGATPPLILQLLGAALLGLAVADWIGRGLVLGGIHGRALVMANAMHWTVGALVLVRAVMDRPAAGLLWVGAGLYGALALAFTWLLRRHPGPPPPAAP